MAVQPQPMPVVNIQPGIFRSPADIKTEVWSSSICDCCDDMNICCFGFWCPCCLRCQTSTDFGECFCLPLLDISTSWLPAASLALRSTMRERYRIQGSICDDCLLVTCCTPCAWCQMARELKLRQRSLLLVNVPSPVQINMHPPQAFSNPSMHLQPMPVGLYPSMPQYSQHKQETN
ncbi:plac8 onzin related protein 6 [Oncorhynchus kisutch]|uniref:Plac8 onzin related protein 6 n=1 Tax=Oncorhynchus kisutch TaxID=8019 RepID=A0A8C7CK98_ONCKI|nr:cornifelin homolog A-like [Oncorhynchus kisutch]